MVRSFQTAADIHVLASEVPIPGLGTVPINAFVLKGSEPILVDTGVISEQSSFMDTLRSVIDPQDLRWLWLSHTDFDHIGSLQPLLEENPRLRVITSFLGVGIMGLTSSPLPLDRVYLINPGERLTLADRTLTAIKPPVFDNPTTTGFVDSRSGAFFSSDCFGALLQSVPQHAGDLTERDLLDGQVLWATIDAPWVHKVDTLAFGAELERIRRIAPSMIFSSHLPPASGRMMDRLLTALAAAPGARPFLGPNQAALDEMLKQTVGA